MEDKKTLIIGSNGQLGTDLLQCFTDNVVPLTHADLEITNANDVLALMRDVRPSVVVNTAAFHNTPRCEAQPGKAYEVNAVGALNLAKACELVDAMLVHISTDYVFDGAKGSPYVESDPVNPLSVYGLSKAAGEAAVAMYCPKHYIVRSCGLYGRVPSRAKGDNFITKICRVAKERGEVTVVDDEFVTPTWTLSLARQIRRLCDADSVRYGVVHASNGGQCSWFQFTEEIFRLTGTTAALRPVSVTASAVDIRRPRYSVLDNRVLQDTGTDVMESWQDALAGYIRSIEPEAAASARLPGAHTVGVQS
jgi:dTDP-4-dehydrorhamnose reductase